MKWSQLSGRVLPELRERFDSLKGENQKFADFITILLDSFENQQNTAETKKETPPPNDYVSPEKVAEIEQLCTNKIGELKTAHTLELESKAAEIAALKTQVVKQETPPPQPPEISKNQLLIDVNEFVLFAIDNEIAAEKKKNNFEFTRGSLLINSFLVMKKNGRVDACQLWSDNEFYRYQQQYLKIANE